jgi:hypothetical protein
LSIALVFAVATGLSSKFRRGVNSFIEVVERLDGSSVFSFRIVQQSMAQQIDLLKMGDLVGCEIADLLAQRYHAELLVPACVPPVSQRHFFQLDQRCCA